MNGQRATRNTTVARAARPTAFRHALAAIATAGAIAGSAFGCSGGFERVGHATLSAGAKSPYQVRYDQCGYLRDPESFAVVVSTVSAATGYSILDFSTHQPVAKGLAGPRLLATTSRAGTPLTADRIDLGSLKDGSYLVELDDGSHVGPIVVGANVYAPILPALVSFLREQRCGATDNAMSLHGACHLFGSAHSSDGVVAADGTRPPYATSSRFDAEGGWHDAGDYVKFVGTTAYVLAVELMALRDHRAALGPDAEALAAELRWGLDWLLKMDGGPQPYHQVGGEGDHEADWRLPDADSIAPIAAYDARPVFRMATGQGRNLLGRSAAAFAFGAEVYAGDPAYARRLLLAAKSAFALAKVRPEVQNPDPPDFYPERSGEDDLVLGAAALAHATHETSYANDALVFGERLAPSPGTSVGWSSVDALALLEAGRLFPEGSAERAALGKELNALAAPIAATARTPVGPGAAFGYALPTFGNGSVAESLGAAATCLAARRLNKTAGCTTVARRQLHWLLGENPFGLSFLVGVGSASPRNLHHALAQTARVTIPGAIVGGPTTLQELLHSAIPLPSRKDSFAMWSTDALLYEDTAGDYVCNEPAIDFTAALVFTLAELAQDARDG
jgi:endoglucanase